MPRKTSPAGTGQTTRSKRKPGRRLPRPTGDLPIGHPGRPTKYAAALAPRAHRLALMGLTDAEIANFFGIAPSTLYLWQGRHSEFSKALQAGKAEADARVAERLYERAIGYSHPAVKIFQGTAASGPVVVPYTEYHPPDVGAAKVWLMNRQKHLWREKQAVEHVESLEARLRAMTPEQRRARLVELQARVDAVLGSQRPSGPSAPITTDKEEI